MKSEPTCRLPPSPPPPSHPLFTPPPSLPPPPALHPLSWRVCLTSPHDLSLVHRFTFRVINADRLNTRPTAVFTCNTSSSSSCSGVGKKKQRKQNKTHITSHFYPAVYSWLSACQTLQPNCMLEDNVFFFSLKKIHELL